MRFVTLDFETYFDSDYTLKKMSTEAYIRDSRFEAHGAAIKWQHNIPARWYAEKELRQVLADEDWSDTCLIAWHANFDGLILSHHYKVQPKLWLCPMSMHRLLKGTHLPASLDAVRKANGLAPKFTPYSAFVGKHWSDLTPAVQEEMADGAEDEVESIWLLFRRFMLDFPREEIEVMSTTIKMFVDPVLRADVNMLADLWESEAARKSKMMLDLNVSEAELQSADKFVTLLEDEGVEVEYKDGKNGPIPAIAKTDFFMQDLLEHDNNQIRTLAEGRLGVKSTILQTRAETLGTMANRGPLCVYLSYAGAGTLRPTGGDKCNWLNFKRGSLLRRSILAPEGYLLAPIDSAQIELRVLHYLAGGPEDPVLETLRNGGDPYADLASKFYGEPIYKAKEGDPRKFEMECKRGAGKQGMLMCGYGAAGKQYQKTARAGMYGPPIDMPREDADKFVWTYRSDNPQITASHSGYWAQANRMLARLAGGDPVQWGPLLVKDHKIFLPNGCPLVYDSLEYHVPSADEPHVKEHERKGFWRMRTRKGWKKMWGAKLTQNLCEAVSRVIVTQAMVRITRLGYRVLNHPYDELLCLIPRDGHEQEHLQACMTEMKREPTWLPGIPLDAEGSLSERYSK